MSVLILLVYAVNEIHGNDDSGDVEEEVYISLECMSRLLLVLSVTVWGLVIGHPAG